MGANRRLTFRRTYGPGIYYKTYVTNDNLRHYMRMTHGVNRGSITEGVKCFLLNSKGSYSVQYFGGSYGMPNR